MKTSIVLETKIPLQGPWKPGSRLSSPLRSCILLEQRLPLHWVTFGRQPSSGSAVITLMKCSWGFEQWTCTQVAAALERTIPSRTGTALPGQKLAQWFYWMGCGPTGSQKMAAAKRAIDWENFSFKLSGNPAQREKQDLPRSSKMTDVFKKKKTTTATTTIFAKESDTDVTSGQLSCSLSPD